jgi:hypothetical protein
VNNPELVAGWLCVSGVDQVLFGYGREGGILRGMAGGKEDRSGASGLTAVPYCAAVAPCGTAHKLEVLF